MYARFFNHIYIFFYFYFLVVCVRSHLRDGNLQLGTDFALGVEGFDVQHVFGTNICRIHHLQELGRATLQALFPHCHRGWHSGEIDK